MTLKNTLSPTPAIPRFIIIFVIGEAVMLGWAILSVQFR